MKPIRFGKYQLLERISHGGMAEVFRAKTFGAAGFERIVAIKLLLPTVAMDRDFITMLIDEAKIAGQLSHANIAQIFDLGMAEGRYYIVQEYVNGKDVRACLRHVSKSGKLMSVAQCCHTMLKVLEGLDYAHNKRDQSGRALNLVHRDVSPQNIVVSREGEVKLIDFGIAKAEGRATRTLAGLVKGKFAYMSPEQIRGLPVDRRSDVFACGIVLHELLTGRPLFRRKSEFETLKRARSAEIEPPSESNPEISPELDAVVLRSLARHVEDRHQTAIAFRDDLWSYVRADGQFYSRNELAAWMRENFPKSSDDDGEYQVEVQPGEEDNATVVDQPAMNAPPTREFDAPSPQAVSRGWGTLDDLAQGPNPDRIEYAGAMGVSGPEEVAVINDAPPTIETMSPVARRRTPEPAMGASMDMLGARPSVPQPPIDMEDETTSDGAKRNNPPSSAMTAQFGASRPVPGSNGNGAGHGVLGDLMDTYDTKNGSMSGTNPYVKAQGSIPPGAVAPMPVPGLLGDGTPRTIGSMPPGPGADGPDANGPRELLARGDPTGPLPPNVLPAAVHSTDKMGQIAADGKTKSVLIAAAVFLLLLAAATSITLSLKSGGAESRNDTPAETIAARL